MQQILNREFPVYTAAMEYRDNKYYMVIRDREDKLSLLIGVLRKGETIDEYGHALLFCKLYNPFHHLRSSFLSSHHC